MADRAPHVVVVDDRPLLAAGVLASLGHGSGDEPPTCTTVDVAGASATIERVAPDVVVIGVPVTAPGTPAFDLIGSLTPDVLDRTVALLADVSPAACRLVVDTGCAGLVGESSSTDEVARAVAAVASGGEHLDPAVVAALLTGSRFGRGSTPVVGTPLTARELDVLEAAADGLSGLQIADRLDVAPSTVKTHLKHAFAKLGAADRAHAVAIGLRRGLIS